MGGTPVLCLTWGRSRIRAGNRDEVEKTWLLSCWALDSAHVSIPSLGFQFLSTDKAKADLTVWRAFSNLTFGGSVRTFCRQNAPPGPFSSKWKEVKKRRLNGATKRPAPSLCACVRVFVCIHECACQNKKDNLRSCSPGDIHLAFWDSVSHST